MTKIEWTHGLNGRVGRTWNPVAGCTVISPGCTNCYAMRMAARINKMTPSSHYEGLTKIVNGNPVWTGKIARAPDKIFNAPLKWGKPTRIFVNSMSDLFHDDMPDEWIDRVFAIIALSPQHTFQILTKRAARMRKYVNCFKPWRDKLNAPIMKMANADVLPDGWPGVGRRLPSWPLPNVWLGVSVEDQARADERIPLLLETPAAVRFISAEPLLSGLDLWHPETCGDCDPCYGGRPDQCAIGGYYVGLLGGLDWVIIGGESGPGKRPVDLAWMRSIRDQCLAAGVPLFVKQIDKRIPIPDDLMIRQWPKGVE